MAVVVAKVELKTVTDASGMAALIKAGTFAVDEVIAVIGKTEGNGGVNDFTRILADQAFRGVLAELGHRSEADIRKIPMIWSGACDGVLTPHATVFARDARAGPASHSRMAIGTAMSPALLPEDIGRPAMVENVAEGVKAAMCDAGISDPADVHYVQTKTPLIKIDLVRDAESRGHHVACEVHDSTGVSTAPPRSALRSDSARSTCRAPSRSAKTWTSIHRSPRRGGYKRRRNLARLAGTARAAGGLHCRGRRQGPRQGATADWRHHVGRTL
jgi:ring-opening amidohydrolase-like protein